jgi:hypothetical protein
VLFTGKREKEFKFRGKIKRRSELIHCCAKTQMESNPTEIKWNIGSGLFYFSRSKLDWPTDVSTFRPLTLTPSLIQADTKNEPIPSR